MWRAWTIGTFGAIGIAQYHDLPIADVYARAVQNSAVAVQKDDAEYFYGGIEGVKLTMLEIIQAKNARKSELNKRVDYATRELGALSEDFESNGNSAAIGFDRVGGNSYGAWQISTNSKDGGNGTMPVFISWLDANSFTEYSSKLRDCGGVSGAKKGTQEFKSCWKELARDDGFYNAQKSFIRDTHYLVQTDRIKRKGIDVSTRSSGLRDVVWSTAVQHGGNTDIISKVYRNGMNDRELIIAIYTERAKRFKSSTKKIRESVKNRFIKEQELALRMV